MSRSRLSLLVAPLALTIVLGGIFISKQSSETAQVPAYPNPAAKGLQVAFDPETGDLVPVRDQVQIKGAKTLNRSHDGLQQVVHADGSAHVDLDGRFQCYATATVDAEGRVQLHYEHGEGPVLPQPQQPQIEE